MRLEVKSLLGQQEALEERVLAMLDGSTRPRSMSPTSKPAVTPPPRRRQATKPSSRRSEADRMPKSARKEERKTEAWRRCRRPRRDVRDVRRSKEGVAIGRFEHGVCGGCHMTLSRTEQVEAFEADIPRCVHCRRILVA